MSFSREQVLSELYANVQLKDYLRMAFTEDLAEDLIQDVFCTLCELSDEMLQYLVSNDKLMKYAAGMIWNLTTVPRPGRMVYDKYMRHRHEELDQLRTDGTPADTAAGDYHEQLRRVEEALALLPEFDRVLLQTYLKNDSNATAVSRETGINKRSVQHYIQGAKKKIRATINSQSAP